MIYIQRDKDGHLVGCYANPQPQPDGSCLTEKEPIAEDSPEVIAFCKLDPISIIKAELSAIDAATAPRFVREGLLGLGQVIEALRAGPLPNLPPAGSGMAKLQAVENQAIALRGQLAPK